MVNLRDECHRSGARCIYDPGQQVARLNGDELKRGITGAFMVVVNIYEASVIYEKTGLTLADLRDQVEIVVITESEKGSKIYKADDIIEVEAFPPTQIADPTGAGDAYRAGFILGLSKNLPLHSLCAQIGALERDIRPGSRRYSESQLQPGGIRRALSASSSMTTDNWIVS